MATENEVRAYDGEVESLTSADSSGVGIRILLDGPAGEGSRLGFAWAGSLDPAVVQDALGAARDNARYATPDPDVVLAEPDGVPSVEQDLWDDARHHRPHAGQDRAGPRARTVHPRRRSTGAPGVLGRLLGQSGGGGAGLDDRNSVRDPADHGVRLGGRHRRRGC